MRLVVRQALPPTANDGLRTGFDHVLAIGSGGWGDSRQRSRRQLSAHSAGRRDEAVLWGGHLQRTCWMSTGLALAMVAAGIQDVRHAPDLLEAFQRLGYPERFLTIIGCAKLVGAPVLLIPKCPHLEEWACAGFDFHSGGAIVSHAVSGDTLAQTRPTASRRRAPAHLRQRSNGGERAPARSVGPARRSRACGPFDGRQREVR